MVTLNGANTASRAGAATVGTRGQRLFPGRIDGHGVTMNRAASNSALSLVQVMSVALAQGVLLYALSESAERGIWPATDTVTLAALRLCVSVVPVVYYLLAARGSVARRTVVLALIGALLAGVSVHHSLRVIGPPSASQHDLPDPSAPLMQLLVFMVLFHALPFLQAHVENGQWRARYVQLFAYAWNNAVSLALVTFITLTSWFLLWVLAKLLRMLGLGFAEIVLFDSPPVSAYTWAVVLGAAFVLAGTASGLFATLRTQLLGLLRWVAVLAAFVLAAFSIALVFRAHLLFVSHRHAISAQWLLTLAISVICLYNAAYQDGEQGTPFPRGLALLMRIAAPLVLMVALLAGYGILIRVDEYGLTVWRVLAIVTAGIATCYGAGFALAAIRGRSWMAGLGTINICVALLLVAVLASLLSPLASPFRLAAANLEHRIVTTPFRRGKLDIDAFKVLRFDTGEYGRARLQELTHYEGHADAEVIRRTAARVAAESIRWGSEAVTAKLVAYPEGTPIDAALARRISSDSARLCGLVDLSDGSGCLVHVLFIDLGGRAGADAIAVSGLTVVRYRRDGNGWSTGSTGSSSDAPVCANDNALAHAIESGDVAAVPQSEKGLRIGSQTYVFPVPRGAPARNSDCNCRRFAAVPCNKVPRDDSDDWNAN